MRTSFLLLLASFGNILCSPIPEKLEEPGTVGLKVSLIDTGGNGHVATQDYGTMLPLELWCYLMDLLDTETTQNMALTCKTIFHASLIPKSLHFKSVQKWLIDGAIADRHKIYANEIF